MIVSPTIFCAPFAFRYRITEQHREDFVADVVAFCFVECCFRLSATMKAQQELENVVRTKKDEGISHESFIS